MYAQDTVSSPINCQIQVRVVECDVCALASKFQRNGFQVALRRSLHNLAANKGAAGERDLFNVHVLADGLPDDTSVAYPLSPGIVLGRTTSMCGLDTDPNPATKCVVERASLVEVSSEGRLRFVELYFKEVRGQTGSCSQRVVEHKGGFR
jgi:hypothetical protein